jgi:hypothetical protein
MFDAVKIILCMYIVILLTIAIFYFSDRNSEEIIKQANDCQDTCTCE